MRCKTDSEIEQWVLRELSLTGKLSPQEVCVHSYDGVVRLRGTAQSGRDKLAVDEAARRAPGVVAVVNEMKVKPCTALIAQRSTAVPLVVPTPRVLLHPLAAKQTAKAYPEMSAASTKY